MLAVLIYIADFVLVFVLVVMFRQIYKSFRSQLAPMYNSKLAATAELPSVTVCIPARNENHALADCLQQVLASTYEKLEIIVLDDMSGDNTSALIKSFASEGVRFVQGSELPKGWLGKNYALQGLLNEASGRYILFIDVDTVLQPNAIEHMVRYAVNHRAAMVSVLPRREDSWRVSVFGSPLRYFWELMFQRRLSPASSSYAWIIRRDILLKKFDGFNALKNTAQPEAKIAAELSAVKQYRFLVGTKKFGISFQKKWRSQLISSVRLLYPALGKQLPLAILVLLDLLLLLLPFLTLTTAFIGIFAGLRLPVLLVLLNSLLAMGFCALYGYYAYYVWNKGWLVAAVIWPLIVLQEMILIIASVFQYKRKTVKWKGRFILPEAQN